ncbi:hypothetical protein TrLO_g2694 [Triparma laevis f. longispina]|uniref:Aldehyde dehydrogenase n=1 Tax=Triparma laevis f. longispina TaxID=1714387 RepID=A0A9W7DM93_9STRA|nr:hypothetical protein TrLO_g2694 [Triparma laevis f. longispina]
MASPSPLLTSDVEVGLSGHGSTFSSSTSTTFSYSPPWLSPIEYLHDGSYKWRINQLLGLKAMVLENEEELMKAYVKDLGKPKGDWFLEKNGILADINHTLSCLHKLMQPETRHTPLWMQPGSTKIIREPLGTVLIIGPYNYPLNLIVCPLAAAVSAGCNAVVKPSEQMPETANFFAKYLPIYLDCHSCGVVLGGIPETTTLLKIKFDKIFFTGSDRVAKIIEKTVAGTLTPMCLELGGKSPVIVCDDANLTVASKRIVQTKYLNCGATCIAPDYIMCTSAVHDKLVSNLQSCITSFYSDDAQKSENYARVLNKDHLERLEGYLNDAKNKGANIFGGEIDMNDRYMAPTILTNVTPDMDIMKEEIFGPILPVMKVNGFEDALGHVKKGEKPLASYCFTSSSKHTDTFLSNISSGASCVNDCAVHVLSPDVPFGGVGNAGMGSYHGREGFICFSHEKAVYVNDTYTDGIRWIRYPPFSGFKEGFLGKVMGKSW